MSFWKRNRDLDDEIRTHLRMAAEDRMARGETQAEAARNVRREFGNELLIKQTARDMWTWTTLERFGQDLKYAFRQMRRTPGFTAVSILTLALGLGATTAMFSVVNGVLLRPLSFREPGRLYVVRTVPPADSKVAADTLVNGRHVHEWRTNCRSCESVSLLQSADLTMVGVGEPVRLPAFSVTSNFFQTLGVQPVLGRDFLKEEDAPGHWGEVILTDILWRTRFAGDPSVV